MKLALNLFGSMALGMMTIAYLAKYNPTDPFLEATAALAFIVALVWFSWTLASFEDWM